MRPTQHCYACGAYPGDPCLKDDDACPFQETRNLVPATPDTPVAETPLTEVHACCPSGGCGPTYRAAQIRGRDDV